MAGFVAPRLLKKKYHSKKTGICSECNFDLMEAISNATSESSIDKAIVAHRRGTCDVCQIQLDRDEQLQEVFTPVSMSAFKRKAIEIAEYKYSGMIFFFTSAMFGVIPVHGTILLIFKSLQLIFLSLGWTIFVIGMKTKKKK